MGTDWAVKEVLTAYTSKAYNNVEVPEEVSNKFLENDWDSYNDEQLIFEGENLYICIY